MDIGEFFIRLFFPKGSSHARKPSPAPERKPAPAAASSSDSGGGGGGSARPRPETVAQAGETRDVPAAPASKGVRPAESRVPHPAESRVPHPHEPRVQHAPDERLKKRDDLGAKPDATHQNTPPEKRSQGFER